MILTSANCIKKEVCTLVSKENSPLWWFDFTPRIVDPCLHCCMQQRIPIWKTAPFLRLLLPLMAGIILQWYISFSFSFIIFSITCFAIAFLLFSFLAIQFRYSFRFLQGIILQFLIACFAMAITCEHDIRRQDSWFGNQFNDSSSLIIRINEPMLEKTKSWKANGYVESVINGNAVVPSKGKLVIYFSKDSLFNSLHYGDRLVIHKTLQRIKNSGNPGAFNYERYAAFQQIFHTVFLKPGEWSLLKEKNIDPLKQFIFSARDHVINILRRFIKGKDELGIAEALLIGYKEDLDKDLVQAYSNAGVVHIIAISGLHLGLIYFMLDWLLARLPLFKRSKVLKVLILLSSLWLFALLTGASASVLRSAVMFTFIVTGKYFSKSSSIYNSLALSAFVLLCYDPYFLWDVGFQLSYLALIGIVALQRPIYRMVYLKQKWLNKIWELASVTLAAQIATFPLCIYYFHQFPNFFLITNIISVPLSTLILFAEILLLVVSWIPVAAIYTGKLITFLLLLMNKIITSLNRLSWSVWDNISANLLTTWLLYLFIAFVCEWLLKRDKNAFRLVVFCLLCFTGLQAFIQWQLRKQVKMVVYNIPRCQAMDFIFRDHFQFVGDSSLLQDAMLQNFHLKPARISMQLTTKPGNLLNLHSTKNGWQFFEKKIMLLDSFLIYEPMAEKIKIDVLIISKNPSLTIAGIANAIKPSIIVFDSSNSLWKIAKWKKECLALALPCFSIPEQGAFVLEID